jgi:hypothetical protein
VTVVRQQFAPQLYVAVFHSSQLPVEVGLLGVSFGLGQFTVQKRGVRFVFQVVKPSVRGCRVG